MNNPIDRIEIVFSDVVEWTPDLQGVLLRAVGDLCRDYDKCNPGREMRVASINRGKGVFLMEVEDFDSE